jgi:hypothetical protein
MARMHLHCFVNGHVPFRGEPLPLPNAVSLQGFNWLAQWPQAGNSSRVHAIWSEQPYALLQVVIFYIDHQLAAGMQCVVGCCNCLSDLKQLGRNAPDARSAHGIVVQAVTP